MDYEFRPRPFSTVVAVLALLAFLALGIWQTARFFEKSSLESLQRERRNLPVQTVTNLAPFDDEANDFRLIDIEGSLSQGPTFYVAYRRHLGHQGCWAVSPLALPNGEVVLAVRGFVIESAPGQCKAPPLPTESQSWRALVHTPPPNPIDPFARKAPAAPESTWQSFDIEGMYAAVGNEQRPTRDTVVILDHDYGDPPNIFAGEDVVAPYLSSTQHLSYAATWFAVMLIVVGLWGAVSVRRVEPVRGPAKPDAV